jgi:hypothetical protein
MALSEGQLYFALSFLIVFIGVMILAYRSDIKRLGIHAKGALPVLGIVILVMTIFYGTVKFLAS